MVKFEPTVVSKGWGNVESDVLRASALCEASEDGVRDSWDKKEAPSPWCRVEMGASLPSKRMGPASSNCNECVEPASPAFRRSSRGSA